MTNATRVHTWSTTACIILVLAGCSGEPTKPATSGNAAGANTTLSAPGQSAAFLTTPQFTTSLALQAGGQYLIAVVNTDSAYTTAEDFTLSGTYASGSGAERVTPLVASAAKGRPVVRDSIRATATPRYAIPRATAQRLASLRKLQRNHLAMLERNTQIFQQYRGLRAASPTVRAPNTVTRIRSISSTIGTVQKIYVAKSLGLTCTDVDSIGARTVAVGQHVIVLADTSLTAWPASLRPDSTFYQAFANEYDAITWPHILTYVGNPLGLDSALSRINRITVVISPVLNSFGGGIVAFVDACDFNPKSPGRSLDNDTEMFYYWTPNTALGWTVQPWEELMRATAAHETKHIVSFTDRIINNGFAVPELIWLEEGLAQESSEIWERHFNQATWKGHATFDQTVGCEIDLGGATACDASGTNPIALTASHLPFLFEYLQEESTSPVGHGLGTDTPSNYGSGWQLARWATDQYGSTESNFIMSLVNEPGLNGLPNLAKHTGRSIQELLVYWSLASAIFDTATYTAADVRTTNPSFDFGNIFLLGQTGVTCSGTPCGLFSANGSTAPAYPVQPVVDSATGTPFAVTVTDVPGTAAYYIMLVAPAAGSEHLQLESGTGGPISTSSGFRVGIIRVK